MELGKQALERGKDFIVGRWKADYVVNFFSDDLKHIPAAEFKSDGGTDMSALCFEFGADHGVTVCAPSFTSPKKGVWSQTDYTEYAWDFEMLEGLPESGFLDNAKKLTVYEGDLVFSLGFLTVALKKQI